MSVRVALVVSGARVLSGMRGRMAVAYDVNVSRPTVGQTLSGWQDAKPLPVAIRSRWQQSGPMPVGVHSGWQEGQALPVGVRSAWQDTLQLQRVVASAYQKAQGLGAAPIRSYFQTALQLQRGTVQRFQEAVRMPVAARQRFQEAHRDRRAIVRQGFQQAERVAAGWVDGMGVAMPLHRVFGGRYQEAWPPRPGRSVVVPPEPPIDPCYLPELPALLVFSEPSITGMPANLVFICERHGPGPEPEEPQYVIPLLRVYMQVHTIKAELLPGNERVPLNNITIEAEDEGFGWTMTAAGPMSLMDQLAPVGGLPAQVRVTIDGIEWIFAIDPPGRSRSFGSRGAQIRGSSVTSLLGDPYMPAGTWTNTEPRTAQQLVLEALDTTGVGVDWDIPDWLIPAGVWNFQGTPLAAAMRIAEAAGAVVRSHRTLPRLQFESRYRHLPWQWATATPNVDMPSRIITSDALEAAHNPPWEAVHLMGEEQGVWGHVVRLGTAEALLAPQVTDALLTHVDVVQERGRAILGAQGKRYMHPMTVPLLTGGTNPGLILPGYLLKVSEPSEVWRGLVRSISITAGMPTVRQSLRVERYLP